MKIIWCIQCTFLKHRCVYFFNENTVNETILPNSAGITTVIPVVKVGPYVAIIILYSELIKFNVHFIS